ncbi:Gamma-glutamyl-gamma-aminobutyrate hydrolase PuuD [compost metagenome]
MQYSAVHSVRLEQGSWLQKLLQSDEIRVNSLHGQGLKNLGKGIEPLARAEDGLVEAIHAPSLSPFLFAVQWHPEWQAAQNPDSVKMFQAFGEACRQQVAKAQGVKKYSTAA